MSASEVIQIVVPTFADWQPKTAKRRSWIALDRGFFGDPKVEALMQEDPTAVNCYIWILTQLDEEGRLEIRADFLKRSFQKITGKTGNRLDVFRYLDLLSNVGLMTFLRPSNDALTTSLEGPKEGLRGKKTPLEPPQTQSGREAKSPYIPTDIPTYDDDFSNRPPLGVEGEPEKTKPETTPPKQPKPKKFSCDAQALAKELQALLRASGQTAFARDWLLTSYSAADSLIRQGHSPDNIRQAMRWALNEWACGKSIVHFKGIASALPHWERANPKATNPMPPPGEFLKGVRLLRHHTTGEEYTPEQCRPDPESPVHHIFTRYGRYRLAEFELVPSLEVVANAS